MLAQSDTLSSFGANQSLLFLLNAVCLVEKQQIPILIVFGLTQSGLKPNIYCTQGKHANHYATDAIIFQLQQDEQWANAHIWYPRCSANRKYESNESKNASHNMGYLYEACDEISDFCHQ